MVDIWSLFALPTASILPFFQAVLSLSFLVLLIIIARLYRGIRILNARVDILSTIVRNLRKEIELTAGIDEVAFEEFDAVDYRLQSQLKGDFSLRNSPSQELQARYAGRDLVRSSINLDAVTEGKQTDNAKDDEAPAPQKPNIKSRKKQTPAPKSKDLESYEAKESGLQVEIKSDFSYIAKPQDNAQHEPIPDIPSEEAQQDTKDAKGQATD